MRMLLRGFVLSFVLAAAPALAQNWPDRPIRFITSQAAGNATDIIARITADQLSTRIGQPVVVENRPGGGNVIGTQAAARAAPDGYTFFLATAAALVTDPYTFKSLPYDPMKDFVPVAKVAEVSFMIMANPKVPAKNSQELIALAKSRPGKLTIATDGTRRFSGMVVSWLNKLAGIETLQVPYTAQRQGVQDAVAGTVDLIILAVPVGEALPPTDNCVRLQSRRSSGWRNSRTCRRLPRRSRISTSPAGLLAAPTGTPASMLGRVNREVDAIFKDPSPQEAPRNGLLHQRCRDAEGSAGLRELQHKAWGRVVREIGVKPE